MNQVESSYETFTNEFLIKQLISSAYSGAVILSGFNPNLLRDSLWDNFLQNDAQNSWFFIV